jgi:flagellar biosynthesis protein FliR
MEPIFFSTAEIARFAVVLMRISGIMLFAPFFSSQSFPVQIRIAFTLVTTFILAPALPLSKLPAELDLGSIIGMSASEILFGIIIGFAGMFVFAGLQFAGQVISFQMGFSLINLIDPQSNVESSVFSFLNNYIGLLFFLLINGHHWFLLAINESFTALPVGGFQIQGSLVEHILRLSAQVLVIGMRIAGPIVIVTIITDVLIGVIGRTAHFVNVLVVGMPLKVLVGFCCLSFSFYFLPRYLGSLYLNLQRTLFSLLNAMI